METPYSTHTRVHEGVREARFARGAKWYENRFLQSQRNYNDGSN